MLFSETGNGGFSNFQEPQLETLHWHKDIIPIKLYERWSVTLVLMFVKLSIPQSSVWFSYFSPLRKQTILHDTAAHKHGGRDFSESSFGRFESWCYLMSLQSHSQHSCNRGPNENYHLSALTGAAHGSKAVNSVSHRELRVSLWVGSISWGGDICR